MGQDKSPKKNRTSLTRRRFVAAAAGAAAGAALAPALALAQLAPGLPGLPGADPGKVLMDRLTKTLLEQKKKQAEESGKKKKQKPQEKEPPRRRPGGRDTVVLLPLPYAANALAPHLSAKSLADHYGKVANDNLVNTKTLIAGSKYAKWDLDQIIKQSYRNNHRELFNHAAEVYNHNVFFQSMKSNGGGIPPAVFRRFLESRFETFDRFKKAFINTAGSVFGSGWVWLYEYKGQPRLQAAPGALTPLVFGLKPLLALDMWEHSFYPDYRNQREKYAAVFLEHLANWNFAANQLS